MNDTVIILVALLIGLTAAIGLASLVIMVNVRQEGLKLAHEINSRMDQLLDERGRSERAAGRLEGPQ